VSTNYSKPTKLLPTSLSIFFIYVTNAHLKTIMQQAMYGYGIFEKKLTPFDIIMPGLSLFFRQKSKARGLKIA